jgi:hypothetical protein
MNTFEQASKVAQILISDLKDENVGIKPTLVKNTEGGWVQIDMNARAILAALTLTIVNGGSQDHWLLSSLHTATEGTIELDLSITTNINRMFIQKGIINRRSTRTQIMRNGRLETRKLWELTDKIKEMVSEIEVEEKRTTRNIGDDRQTGWVKGTSIVSKEVKEILKKLDSVPFRLHPATELYCEKMHEIVDDLKKSERDSKRRDIEAVEDEFSARGNQAFQFTHRMDTRGRIYALAGMMSYQGSKLQKAVLQLAETEKSTDWEAIKIYLAREKGFKGTNLEASIIGEQIIKNPQTLQEVAIVSSPANSIIRKDGVSNGIQWISALTGDLKGCKLVNVVGTKPNDLYSYIADKFMLDDRNQAKALIMPLSYGASAGSLARSTGIPRKEIEELIEQLEEEIPVTKYLEYVKRKARTAVRKGETEFLWEMPDGLLVHHNYQTSEEVLNIGNFSANVGEMVTDETKLINALPPNLIHSIDAYHARLIVDRCDFPVVPIHDSFGCHSSNVNEMETIIRETFQEIVKADILNQILDQLGFGSKWNAIDPDLIQNPYIFM